MKYQSLFLVLFLILAGSFGCSSGGPVVTAPDDVQHPRQLEANSHYLWGLYQCIVNPEAQSMDVIPLRSTDLHLNALHFLEPPALSNLTLESLAFNGNMVEANVGLRHPFLGLTEFTGFDVCGIVISHGSIGGFTDPDLLMPGPNNVRLVNADGFTRWWNPAEFPLNNGTMFCYKDGLLGTPDSAANYTATLNGYKYFCDDLTSPNDPMSKVNPTGRGVFPAGTKLIRHYSIDMGTGLVFNYAVDACWQFPTGPAPWDVPGDFPAGANRKEAWNIKTNIVKNTLWNDGTGSGGELGLSIDVYDWFSGGANLLTVESPGNLIATLDIGPSGTGVGYSTFTVDITSATPAQTSIDLLITVKCEAVGYGNLLPGKTQAVYFTTSVPVSAEPPVEKKLNLIDVTPPGWPATLRDVWIDGNYAYCVGYGGGLLILDISGSGDPTYVGGYYTGGEGLEVQVYKEYCYIANGSSGLLIFNISNPTKPNLVATYPTSYSVDGIHVPDGSYCFVANGKGGVVILDIGGGTQGGSPENPKEESKFSVSYAARDIFFSNKILYVADYETRFLAIDIGGGTHGGSPASPQWEGEIKPFNSEEIFVAGSYAYVCSLNQKCFYTIDISNPAKMQLVDTDYTTYDTQDLWVDGGYLYTAQYLDGLLVYSLGKPDNPSYAGTYNTPGQAFGVCKVGSFCYVADYYYGLRKVNVTTPGSPKDAGKYFTPSHITDVQAKDGYVYTADGTCGMAVVDVGGSVGSPLAPLTLVRWTQPSGDTDARGIWVESGYAYIGGGFMNFHLTIADIGAGTGSPQNPVAKGDHFISGNRLYGMQKMGKYLYAAAYNIDGGNGGLEVYDVDGGTMGGSPSSPKRTFTYPICTTWEVYTIGGYVYVASGQNSAPSGLYVFDAGGGTGSPNAPKLVESYLTKEHLYDVNVLNGYAFVCGGGYGDHWMRVFDVGAVSGTPDNVIEVGYYDFPTGTLIRGLGVMDGYVLLVPGQSASSLIAIDVGGGQAGGAPNNPQFVDDVKFPTGDAFCVAIDGQYAYVGTHSFGLRIVQLWQ